MQFNEAQQEAVDFYQGPCLTLAGPGSGKTAVITHRTKNLIEKYGVSPSEILVVTFTKAAAMEMKERFLSLTNQTSTTATFGTFHAVFFTVLKYAYHYRAENIIREMDKFQRSDSYDQIKIAGFDIIETAHSMEKFYIDKGESRK